MMAGHSVINPPTGGAREEEKPPKALVTITCGRKWIDVGRPDHNGTKLIKGNARLAKGHDGAVATAAGGR
jgi:hypothetical protein